MIKVEIGYFIFDCNICCTCGIETVGYSIIISAESNSKTIYQLQVEFIACNNELLEAVERGFYIIPDLFPFYTSYLRVVSYFGSVSQNQAYVRKRENCILFVHYLIR